jgi:hypothetical protein
MTDTGMGALASIHQNELACPVCCLWIAAGWTPTIICLFFKLSVYQIAWKVHAAHLLDFPAIWQQCATTTAAKL